MALRAVRRWYTSTTSKSIMETASVAVQIRPVWSTSRFGMIATCRDAASESVRMSMGGVSELDGSTYTSGVGESDSLVVNQR